MDSLELYNFNEEESLSYNITIKHGVGENGSPWLGFTKTSGTIPPRSGETTQGKKC